MMPNLENSPAPEEDNGKELNDFQIRNIEILTHMLRFDVVDDEIIDKLRASEIDYFSLMDKYRLLEHKSNFDEKTKLLKFSDDYLIKIIKTASRILEGTKSKNYQICFVRFDIDNFSVFNNKYGHSLGDDVLVAFAAVLKENSRPTDYVIRFGGEEFDVILPSTTMVGTEKYLDKIFKKVRALRFAHDSEQLFVTVSAGVSQYAFDLNNIKGIRDLNITNAFHQLQNEADNALYQAKFEGKDCWRAYDPEKQKEYAKIRKAYIKNAG